MPDDVKARIDFEEEAARRFDEYRRTGEYYTLEDLRAYILARARGENPPKPPLRKDPRVAGRSADHQRDTGFRDG